MKKKPKKEEQYIEYEDGTHVLLDEDDTPELTAEWFKNAKHGLDGLSELIGEEAVAPLRKRGRPIIVNHKLPVKIRLDADIVATLRATGKGWQTRLNSFLHKAIEQGQL